MPVSEETNPESEQGLDDRILPRVHTKGGHATTLLVEGLLEGALKVSAS